MSVFTNKPSDEIVVTYVYPPIAIRSMDYQAYFDSFDGAEDADWQCSGYGRTMLAALQDFYDDWEVWNDDEPLCVHRPMVKEDLWEGFEMMHHLIDLARPKRD